MRNGSEEFAETKAMLTAIHKILEALSIIEATACGRDARDSVRNLSKDGYHYVNLLERLFFLKVFMESARDVGISLPTFISL